MAFPNIGYHHLDVRKRIHEKREQYPHPNTFIRAYDKALSIIVLFGPLLNVPQIIEIFLNHNAQNVSLVSWVGFSLLSIIWLSYGIIHKAKPIIFSNIIFLITNLLVVLGVVLYS
ncbi:MAG: hypothetical protein V1725_03895 [archaeon]